jgi:metal-responsive CopG/Arc/MetJ family transcriptional regulator
MQNPFGPDDITVSLPTDLSRQLERFCREARVSRAQFVREALEHEIFSRALKLASERLLPESSGGRLA